MKTINGINNTHPAYGGGIQDAQDPAAAAKQVETVFLNEFLKIMMEQTSFGKDKTVSNFMPIITTEISKSLAERGVGVGEMLMRNPLMDKAGENEKDEDGVKEAGGAGVNKKAAQQFPSKDSSGTLKLKAKGKIASGFGIRVDPIDGKLRQHNGLDVALPSGTPVKPAAPGKVVFSGKSGGYGNCVIIEHENGVTTLYAHNAENTVQTGDVVDTTRVIALSGSSGRSTGPHLHFEVRKDGVPVNPAGLTG